MEIDKVVSLGATCQTRWHLQRYSVHAKGNDFSSNHFFDWLWTRGDITGVIEWIGDGLYIDPELFSLAPFEDHYQVFSKRYGLFFPHDIKIDTLDLYEAESIFSANLNSFIEKRRYLAEKFRTTLRNGYSVFAYHGQPSDDQLNRLASVLTGVYFCKSFDVVIFVELDSGIIDYASPGIEFGEYSRIVKIPVIKKAWPGDYESWRKAWDVVDSKLLPSK